MKGSAKPNQDADAMTPTERRAAKSLASIYSLRMLGLFMILPVFAIYGQDYEGSTPALMGLALGAYGLTQALFQIPFGMASDKFGRKPIIALGLIIFAIGSVVAATSDTMWGVIIGRAIQGAGAIAAAVMALAADLTREEHRVKAMAVIGASIGVSFAISLVAGPAIVHLTGIEGIFWLTAMLSIAGIGVLYLAVPDPVKSTFHRDAEPVPAQFKNVLSDPELLRLDAGIFILHMVLTASFVALPLVLRDAGLAPVNHWWVYLPVLLLALIIMVPFVVVAEKKRRIKPVFVGAVAMLMLSEVLLLIGSESLMSITLSLFIFFIAFNVVEATLPSLVAKISPPHIKGTAMGVYSTSQFGGAFVGGVVGGLTLQHFGVLGVFFFCVLALAFWLFLASTMRTPKFLGTFMIRIGPVDEAQAKKLVAEITAVTGVAEAIVIPEDEIAYLKIDNRAVDKAELMRFSVQE